MKRANQWFWLIIVGLGLAACGQDGEPTPTAGPPTGVTPAAVPTSPPEPTAADTPAATDTLTLTDTPAPTDTPASPTATATTAVTTPPEPLPELTLLQPPPDAEVAVGQALTVSGIVSPPTAAVEAQITVTGGEAVWQGEATANEAGEWMITAVLSSTITGPAELTTQVAGMEMTATVPLALTFAADAAGPTISISHPAPGDVAVAGRVLLFDGRVQSPVNETVTIAVLDNDCTSTAASQSFTVPGGNWVGYTIVAAEAALGPACAVAYTGARGSADGGEVRVPVTLISAEDERATILQLGNDEGLTFRAGESTYLFGVAINAPENEVSIRLEADDPARPSGLLTSAFAYANRYGYWEIELEVPEGVQGQALLTITSGSTEQNYREIRIPVIVEG